MSNRRRLILAGITHGAAVLLGWAAWAAFHHSRAPESESGTANSRARQHPAGGAKSLDEILAIISPKKQQASEESVAGIRARYAIFLAEFSELVKTMPVPDDLEAALAAEMKLWDKEDRSAKLAVLMYQWARKDFAGLLKWVGGYDGPNAIALVRHSNAIWEKILSEKGPDSLISGFSYPQWGNQMMDFTAHIIGSSPDLGQIEEFKEKLSPQQWQRFSRILISDWSWKEKSRLVEFAVSEHQPEMIALFASLQGKNGPEAGAWLLEVIKDENLDAGFREKLAKDGNLNDFALSNSNLPMNDRIALMQGGDPNAQANQSLYDQLATSDANNLFQNSHDWGYEFRVGKMDAAEVLAELTKEMSGYGARSPDALRKTVFENLVEEDSARAMVLLGDLPPAERAKAVIDVAQARFYAVDPNLFLTALQQVPADDPQLWDARLNAWVKHAPDNYRRLDADYVSWVRALPDGVDRDMALYSLALVAANDYPSLAADLRAEVQNDDLKQRISKTQ